MTLYYFIQFIKSLFSRNKKEEVKEVVVQVYTLTPTQYSKLEALLPNCRVSPSDNAEVVAHKLGVQLALETIRKGFVA